MASILRRVSMAGSGYLLLWISTRGHGINGIHRAKDKNLSSMGYGFLQQKGFIDNGNELPSK